MSESSSSNESPDTTEQPAAATVPVANESPDAGVAPARLSRSERLRARLAGTSRPTRIVGAAVAAVVLVLLIGTAGFAIGHAASDEGGGSHGERHSVGPDDRGGRHDFGDRRPDGGRGNDSRGNDDSQDGTTPVPSVTPSPAQ